MLYSVLIILVSCFILQSCNDSQDVIATYKLVHSQTQDSPADTICPLKENLFVIGGVPADIAYVGDKILLSVGPNVVMYNQRGEQVKEFGRFGSGPGEYIKPTQLYVSTSKIYIWCEQALKILTYNLEGKYIREDRYGTHAIKDFSIWDDKYICFLMYGEPNNRRIEIYEIETRKHIRTIYQKNNTDDMLAIAGLAGGICIANDSLYWCNPSATGFYALSLKNIPKDTPRHVSFNDPEFLVDIKNTPQKEMMNTNPPAVFSFIRNNSRMIQMFNKNDTIALLAEIGIAEYRDKIINHRKRKLKLYMNIKGNDTIRSYTFNYPKNYGLIKGINNQIDILTGYYNEDSLIIHLSRRNI